LEIHVKSLRKVLELEQVKAVTQQIKAFESRFTTHDVLANLPTGLERFQFMQCFVWRSFLPPTVL